MSPKKAKKKRAKSKRKSARKKVAARRKSAPKKAGSRKRKTARKKAGARKRKTARRKASARKRKSVRKKTAARKRSASARGGRKPRAKAQAKKRTKPRAKARPNKPVTAPEPTETPDLHVVQGRAIPEQSMANETSGVASLESAKQEIIFQLMRARAAVLTAIHGLSAEAAELPHGEGKWNTRQIVLHLVLRDRARLREIEGALLGTRASWENYTPEEMNQSNADGLVELGELSWDEAVELLSNTRGELLDEIESVPEEPSEVWTREHAFGWMLHGLPKHDLHHAEVIQSWRAEQSV